MPFFPSLQRPVEYVPGLPGAIGAGTVSSVQLFDLDQQVMRSVTIMGSVDGCVYALGNMSITGGAIGVGSASIGASLLIDADATCGPQSSPAAAMGSSTASGRVPHGTAGQRPWRVQSVVAYRTSYNECAVIVARIPTVTPLDMSEYGCEILFFRTQPLHCLACPSTHVDGLPTSTARTVLSARAVRPGEHVMRLFTAHVEPSATGSRINSAGGPGRGLGAIRYAQQSPPGITVLCSSVVRGDVAGVQKSRLTAVCFPMSAADRVRSEELVRPFAADGVLSHGHTALPLWADVAEAVSSVVQSPLCSIAITCTATPEPRAALSSVGWMVAVGCIDGTVLLARTAPAATGGDGDGGGGCTVDVIGQFMGPAGWLQFFSNKSIHRPQAGGGVAVAAGPAVGGCGVGTGTAEGPRMDETRSAAIDGLLGSAAVLQTPAAGSSMTTPLLGSSVLGDQVGVLPPSSSSISPGTSPSALAAPSFGPQLCLLGLDVAGRVLQWTDLAAPLPTASYVLDAEELSHEWDDVVLPHQSAVHEGEGAGAMDSSVLAAIPSETPEKRRKDKSLVERWLNRKVGGGGGPIAGSQADLAAMVTAAPSAGNNNALVSPLIAEDSSRLRLSEAAATEGGPLQASRARFMTLRDLNHVHSNSGRLTVVDGGRGGSWVGTILGRGVLAAAFVDHCFDDESHLHGPQLLVSTLGRVIAFCAPYRPPCEVGDGAAASSAPARPHQQVGVAHTKSSGPPLLGVSVAPPQCQSEAVVSSRRLEQQSESNFNINAPPHVDTSASPARTSAASPTSGDSNGYQHQRGGGAVGDQHHANHPLAVMDYFDVFSPMTYLGLVDFSGVGDSVLVMASSDQVAIMPLHDRPAAETLSERLAIVKRLLKVQ